MNTQTRAAKNTKRLFVPVTGFEFESFEIPVRPLTCHKPVPIGVTCRKLHFPRFLRPLKAKPGRIGAPKIFLPSPSLQGQGLTCLHVGARPLDPAALPSPQFRIPAPDPVPKGAEEAEPVAPQSHK